MIISLPLEFSLCLPAGRHCPRVDSPGGLVLQCLTLHDCWAQLPGVIPWCAECSCVSLLFVSVRVQEAETILSASIKRV